jgi:outer membrane receptor for ferrienterochelin and colicins
MRSIGTQTVPLFLASASLAFSLQAKADERYSNADFYNLSLAELGQVEISIATGNSTPLDKAPAAATVISSSEIAALGARDLNDVLETVPGLHVSLSTLSRLDSVYSIRGIHTGFNPQVLLMLNGVPVQSSLQGGRPSLFRLPVASIDRVEVIRGPGSAVYGADAYAGVINVITKDSSVIGHTELGGSTGSFGSRDLWLRGANRGQEWGVALNVAYQESDGDSGRVVDSDLQSFLDSLMGTSASLAPGTLSTRYKILDTHLAINSEQTRINLWNWVSKDAGIGAGGAQVLDYGGHDESSLWMLDFTHHLASESSDWDNNVRLSYLYYDLQSEFTLFPAGAVLPISSDGNLDFINPAGKVQFPDGLIGNPGQKSADSQVDFVSIYSGWESHRLRFATGVKKQTLDAREYKNYGPGVIDGTQSPVGGAVSDVSGTDYIFLADSSRTIRYLSVQDEWRIMPTLELTAGVRYDDYSDFGGTTNPRIALVWSGTEKLTTKLLYGSAFRAPSFMEQRSKNNPVALGNANLDPEKIDTLELSLSYLVNENFQSTLTLFDYRARDMIEFIPDQIATTKTARNIRDQDGNGFELEATWKPAPAFHLSSSYSYQDSIDAKTHNPVIDAPKHLLKVGMNWEVHKEWSVNSQFNWVGGRERAVFDTRGKIDDYGVLDLLLKRDNLFSGVDAAIVVRNLTNEDAREPSSGEIMNDYPLESRSYWLTLQYQFH